MRLALCPINPTIGDLAGNAALAADAITRAREAGADLAVLPELCVSGYPPKDLLFHEGFVAACGRTAREIGEKHSEGMTVVFGCPLHAVREAGGAGGAGGVTNSLVVYRDGRLLARYDKRLLPTYDVFDEDRYFTPGSSPVVIEVPVAGGTTRVGLAVCEDLWKGEDAGFSSRYHGAADPVAEAVGGGAAVIVSPSASPFVLGKGHRHREIVAAHAARHNVFVASVNQLGGNDDLVFDGHCFAYGPGGVLIAEGMLFREGLVLLELASKPRPRMHVQGFLPPHLDGRPPATLDTASPGAPDELLLFEALVQGVRDYVRKTGFRRAIVGLSGGIDSALTAAIAAAAIGPRNVLGVAMPGPYSSGHALADAMDLAERLGVRCDEAPIGEGVDGLRRVLDREFASLGCPALGVTLPDLTEENLQSRVRGTVLMGLSNRTGAIVLTTGNKSELAVGYCTLYGDMNGGLAVLSDVSKAWVYRLAKWINANPVECGFASPPIPERSITKPPSAELRPDQTDQDTLPPYDVLDAVIERYVERRQSAGTIVQETGFDAALVKKLARMIDLSEYKRNQAAVGLKVTTVAFGPGRRWPIAQKWTGA